MTFKAQRLAFAEILINDYPLQEINSFFYLLTAHHFGYNKFETHQKDNEELPYDKRVIFDKALDSLKKKEPIQYIIGETEFYGLPFKVTKHTLIPRPETEELVELIIEKTKNIKTPLDILDIGTGTGCIAITLAKKIVQSKVTALDISAVALKVAKENAANNTVSIRLVRSDILQTLSFNQKYDVIVSNPPYVRDLEKKFMHSNVIDFEPESALFVRDNDPLIFYKKIAELAISSLKPKGLLFFEINEYLALEMTQLLEKLSYIGIEVKKDIYGKDRVVICNLKQ